MARTSRNLFTTVKSEGGLLPPDFLRRLVEGAKGIDGLTPESFHLSAGEKPNEAASRSWNRLQAAWVAFRTASQGLRAEDAGTGLTREKWLMPLFQELGYGRLQPAKDTEIDGKAYPISHVWQHTPIHLVGRNVELDRRSPGVIGAARTTPHGLLQEFLNRHEGHLWGFVSNGLKLRILRDNKSLTRQAYVEFDLAGMMDGQIYSDFALLWLLCHQSRVEAEKAEQCWLEKWTEAVRREGVPALDRLRKSVEAAIESLGKGFLAHPANKDLIDTLRAGSLDKQDYYRQLLRVVYRLIFLFVAEDRDLLLTAPAGAKERSRYLDHYSVSRLRSLAERRRGTPHPDLWRGLKLVFGKLSDTGCKELGLPALGSFLWSDKATPDLDKAEIANADLLDAVRSLAFTRDGKIRRTIDYRNLGAEELGSVYESLLELHPDLNADAPTFALKVAAGHERKTTGSYYTPTSLIECLLDSALDPVLDEAAKKPDPEKALLDLKVCDPACGSGHFLIAAAHRMANRLAKVRTGDEEPSPQAVRKALRDIVGRCLYGVDINPMAVELCKVNLWLEALEPGKPLSFLEHHIQCGNSLLGATPDLLDGGIPDAAFEPRVGDDKARSRIFMRMNRAEREGQGSLLDLMHGSATRLADLADSLAALDAMPDDEAHAQRQKQASWDQLVRSEAYKNDRLKADAWCAAFVWRKDEDHNLPYPVTNAVLRRIDAAPTSVPEWLRNEIQRLAAEYQFFHWHLAFPRVFCPQRESAGAEVTPGGGFDVTLGNPPWVRQETLAPIKSLLRAYQAFDSTADSSVYFLERSLQTTRPGGRAALLTPNKWFRATYAEGIRRLLREKARMDLLIDFGHSRTLFPDADTFPAAVVFQPALSSVGDTEPVRFVLARDSDRRDRDLADLVRSTCTPVPHRNLRPDRWRLEDSRLSRLVDRLINTGQRLESYLGQPVVRGLLTGFNEAFYLDTAQRDAHVADDPGAATVLKKLLRGRDVRRWVCEWAGQWHIVLASSDGWASPWAHERTDVQAEQVFAKSYPSVHRHLKQYEQSLRMRRDRGKYWWELRSCDYYDILERPKIVVQCIAYFSQFALEESGSYVNNKVLVVSPPDLYVLAVLNSRITWWLANRTFQHMKDEGLSVDVQFLRRLPIPDTPSSLRGEIARLAAGLVGGRSAASPPAADVPQELALDALVEQAFGLSADERELLLSSLPPRDPLDVATKAGGHLGDAGENHLEQVRAMWKSGAEGGGR
jgi:hypothetical protein